MCIIEVWLFKISLKRFHYSMPRFPTAGEMKTCSFELPLHCDSGHLTLSAKYNVLRTARLEGPHQGKLFLEHTVTAQ